MEPRLIAAACLSGATLLGSAVALLYKARLMRADRRRRRGIKDYNSPRRRETVNP